MPKRQGQDEDSVFSRLMNTRVAQVNRKPDGQVAAIIVFSKETTTADVKDAIREMGPMVESSDVQEFKPEYGWPVIFFP
jgi:hypothetical protein